ncbi:MAG: oligopeptide/dipeptide ABC transporter ATP-binding protein [Bacillota bacterium]
MEKGETEKVTQNPLHPYTKALISAVPVPDPFYNRDSVNIKGGISKPINPPPYCRFYDRCPERTDKCKNNPVPELEKVEEDHYVACYYV